MYYTEKELEQLIKSVEKEFSAELAMAKSETAEVLAKAEDKPEPKEEKPEAKEEPHAEKEQEHAEKEAGHAEEEQGHAEKEAAHAEEEAGHAEKEHEMHMEHEEAGIEDPAAAGHDYDEEDLEHMHKMYMSMSPAEQRAHHDALRKCMDASMAKAEEIERQEPNGPEGARAEASKVDGDRLNKLKKGENPRRGSGGQQSEQALKDTPGAKSDASFTKNKELYKDEDGIEHQEPKNALGPKSDASYTPNKELYDMGKSEDFAMLKSELDAQKAKAETLQKTLDGVTEFLTKLAQKTKVPQGKAVTSYDVIAKSESGAGEQPMTKSEVVEILSKKAQDPSLSKADREAINAFYLNNASFNSISHLLK